VSDFTYECLERQELYSELLNRHLDVGGRSAKEAPPLENWRLVTPSHPSAWENDCAVIACEHGFGMYFKDKYNSAYNLSRQGLVDTGHRMAGIHRQSYLFGAPVSRPAF
jgi:hypothetical protein